jgi:hypothetical protein
MWVSRPTSGVSRCARSPRPVSVGAKTSWPAARNRGVTFFQHHPPSHAPWTNTNVARKRASRNGSWLLRHVDDGRLGELLESQSRCLLTQTISELTLAATPNALSRSDDQTGSRVHRPQVAEQDKEKRA